MWGVSYKRQKTKTKKKSLPYTLKKCSGKAAAKQRQSSACPLAGSSPGVFRPLFEKIESEPRVLFLGGPAHF